MAKSAIVEDRQRVRDLNETLRRTFSGGQVMLTAGVTALPLETRAAVLAAIRSFEAFDADNDPHGEHDFGMFVLARYCCIWKIDCYDLGLRCASPNPADPAVKSRVLIVMLAEEY